LHAFQARPIERLASDRAGGPAITAGCATPPGSSWANFRTRREIEKIAADDSFPTAAEIGLTMSDSSPTDGQ